MRHDWSEEKFDWDSLYKAERLANKLMKRLGRIGVHSKEKFGCYDSETEVLTDNGWKLFKDVDIDHDKFLSIDENDNIFYQKASHYFEYKYSGKMYKLETRGVDLLVTPNHNLYLAKAPKNGGVGNKGKREFPYEFSTYEKYFRIPKIFKKGGIWKGTEINRVYINETTSFPADSFLALLGWYVAEGSSSKTSQITFSLNYKSIEELNLVENIILESGLTPKVFRDIPKKRGGINVYNRELMEYLKKECGMRSENKKCPEFIKQLSPRQINIFLDNLYKGDGHKAKTSHILTTVSKKLADDVSELLLKNNKTFRISNRDRTDHITYIEGRAITPNFRVYEINWLKNSNTHITPNSHDSFEKIEKQESMVDYDGKVFCVEVPNHILYVRRNGIGVFCGNSIRWGIYLFDGTLHSFTHPGYVYSQYPKWLWIFDCNYKPLRFLKFIVVPWQKLVVKLTFSILVKKYPHIVDEIISDAPRELLTKELSKRAGKLWKTSCRICKTSYTCDNEYCPTCGKE